MLKITKKEFKRLHDNKKLLLIGSFESNREDILQKIKEVYNDNRLHTIETSRVDIEDVKDHSKANIFKDNKFILVENNITDKMYGDSINTICYLIK